MRACKKQNNFCENTTIMIMVVCFLAACNQLPRDDGTAPPPLYTQPKSIAANPEGGYAINSITGDSIKPIINSLGDTVVTGVPIPAVGKVIHPDSVARPKSFKMPPKRQLTQKFAHTNRHKIPENIPTFPIDFSQLKTVEYGKGNPDFVLINSTGDTVKTGVPIPVKGKTVNITHPKPTYALPPAIKDAAITNIQYLDVDQGMNSSYIMSILEDRKGNLWFGTYGGGVSMYNGETFTHYTEKEGFLLDYVWSILEDRKGNLWFGTDGRGVSMYDGETFTHYTEKEGLSKNHVRSILEDQKGNIWIGTDGGGVTKLSLSNAEGYNGETLPSEQATFTHYTEKEGLSNNKVWSILEDQKGKLWFGTDGGGVSILDGETLSKGKASFTHITEKEGLSNNKVWSILEDQMGSIWIGTYGGGVNLLDGETIAHYTVNEGFSHNSVVSILEDQKGNLWFGTDGGGLSMYGGETFTQYTENEGLSNNRVWSIFEDRSGNLWLGTDGGGISIYKDKSFTHYTEKEGLSQNRIWSILEDRKGHMWFGTFNGILNMFDGESFTHYTEKEGLSYNMVYSIFEDQKGNLWFGTIGGGVSMYDGESFTHYTEKEGLSNNKVRSIIEDQNGNIWFGTIGGGVSMYNGENFTHYTENEGLSNNRVWSILEDRKGNLWFGTAFGGVTMYNDETFTHYTEKEGLISNVVWSILEDRNGNLWFGTFGGGVSMYNGETFRHYTEKEGLSNNIVRSILEDMRGNLYFATDKGLNIISPPQITPKGEGDKTPQITIHNFLKGDGLKGLDFFSNSALIDNKNRAWWGTGKSLVMLDLNKFSVSDIIPQPTITRLDINEEFINYRDRSDSLSKDIKFTEVPPFENYPINLSLPYNKNHLTFHFVAIDWAAPHKIQYSYRMLGLDNRWSSPTKEAKTDYRNLSFGTYTFQVRAIGESGEWSAPFQYTFTIRPPWWHSWWAYCVYAILLMIVGYRVHVAQKERTIRIEREKIKDREIQQAREIEQAYTELKSTQAQLIHAEKMASLGELTAGIAHEIQNPLNFVNNFSEVSIELIDELRSELDEVKSNSRSTQQDLITFIQKRLHEADHILNDLAENQQKINHHGKRADAIVKGMLQHSRSGSGQKEPTDINALVDEYLRLSYHGLRAKDKSFNAAFETHFDPNLPKVKVMPQDIGRVLLNLINNAFYAVDHRNKNLSDLDSDYKPIVTVTTKNLGDKIEISVQDNGSGIPDDIKDKIFQPFFTTKPTGQGTGLGLSLSYDIVKAHGGQIELESKEGEGTVFTIYLTTEK